MTLSLLLTGMTSCRDFIPHSNPHRYKIHALSGITIGWQKSWPFRLSCFSVQGALASGEAKRCSPVCNPLLRSIAGISLASGLGNWATAGDPAR